MNASDSESDVTRATDADAATLHLRTLGDSQLLRRRGECDEVLLHGANKALALFTYLACAPGRGATREHLQDLLWERQGPERAQGALRTYLWKLRTILGANAIIGDEYVVLAVACEVDRDQLVEAADRGDAGSVVAMYSGDFFPAFTQPDSPQFDLWVQSERLRLRGIFSRCAERVVGAAVDSGRFRDALMIARKLRDSDPMDESGWRPLLSVLVASGDSINAANEASVLERLLAADERVPQPATVSMLKSVARMTRTTPGAEDAQLTLVAPLVARDREFAILTTSWARARTQTFGHVHVRAPAGMGKSRLLDDFAARLRHDRSTVARARADMGRRDLPYAFIGAVVADLAGRRGAKGLSPGSAKALLAIDPALSAHFAGDPDSSTGDEALRRRTLAFAELLAAVSEEQPFALILDDLQWADAASCAVLAASMSSAEKTPYLLVTAGREGLSPLFSSLESATIVLSPLDVDAVTELVQSLAALPETAWAQGFPQLLQRTTTGVPLHVLDALTLAMERGVLVREGQCWHSSIPAHLEQLLSDGATLPRRVESLSDAEHTVLLVLSVAGEPCERQRLRDVTRSAPGALDHSLALLERAGYLSSADGLLRVAHDAIAEAILAHSPEDTIAGVHADLAMSMMSESRKQSGPQALLILRSALMHAWRADAVDVLRLVFDAYVLRVRKQGDARSLDLIAGDVLNSFDAPAARAKLIALSSPQQIGIRSAARRWRSLAGAGAIAIVASLSGAWFATRQALPEPDGEVMLVSTGVNGQATLSSLTLNSADWIPGKPIVVDQAVAILTIPNDPMLRSAVTTGRRDEWIGSMIQSDSGVTDLFRLAPETAPKRLTFSRGDDVEPAVSPDGKQVVFSSAQWSDQGARSLAILDLRSGRLKRLTASRGSDASPVWSPDGRRIAFARTSSDGARLCTIAVSGHDTGCLEMTSGALVRPWAWQSPSVLTVELPKRLVRVNVDSSVMSLIDSTLVVSSVSADGRWIASIGRSATDAEACRISPTERPLRVRSLESADGQSVSCMAVRWGMTVSKRVPYVDAVRIDPSAADPVVGAPHRFSAMLVLSSGDAVSATSLEWTSSDTAIAYFGVDGQLYPRNVGAVTIRASYGGWRYGERRIDVRAPRTTVVLQESWNNGVVHRWAPFGDPTPRTVSTGDDAHAFLNNGDGVFQSGVHTTFARATQHGLALDTWLSTPVTLDHWQVVRLGLYVGIDSSGLARWNHRDGWAFAPDRQHAFPCEFVYPSGQQGTNRFTTAFETAFDQLPAPAVWRSGVRFRLRLQIFPDGRCGAAINGRPVALGDMRAPAGGRAHVFIYGNSPGTKMLVGPVTVTEGVPSGVDWFGPARTRREQS